MEHIAVKLARLTVGRQVYQFRHQGLFRGDKISISRFLISNNRYFFHPISISFRVVFYLLLITLQ